MKLKINLTGEEKKLLGRIFVRLTPLLKSTFGINDSYIDLFEIVKILPIKLNLFEWDERPEDVSNIDVFFAVEKAGELNDISIQVNIYQERNGGDNFEALLKNIVYTPKKLSQILLATMRELLGILHKYYHPIVKNRLLNYIKKLRPELKSDQAEAVLNVAKYCYTNLSLYNAMSQNGIKKNIPISEVLGGIFDDYINFPNKDIEQIIRIIIDFDIKYDMVWERIHCISLSNGTDTIKYLGRFFNISKSIEVDDGAVDTITGIKNTLSSRLAGSNTTRMMDLLGVPIEVQVDWLGELKGLIFEETSRYTTKQDISYRKIKNKFRHIAKLPGTINYDNKLRVICVVDQSGSVGDYELRKINFIMQKLSEKAKEFDLIIHDYDIVAHEKFKNRTLMNDVKDYVQKRQCYGGTCHTQVFERIEEEYLDPRNKKDKFVVLTFSDMYSNIEQLSQSKKYTWVSPNSKVSKYWVTTDKEITSVDGIHIHVDKGRIK